MALTIRVSWQDVEHLALHVLRRFAPRQNPFWIYLFLIIVMFVFCVFTVPHVALPL